MQTSGNLLAVIHSINNCTDDKTVLLDQATPMMQSLQA